MQEYLGRFWYISSDVYSSVSVLQGIPVWAQSCAGYHSLGFLSHENHVLSAFAQRFGPRLGLAREFLAGPLDPNREAKQINNENILTIVSQTRKKDTKHNIESQAIQGNYDIWHKSKTK